MNVLVLGSGGREHALSWKIAQSSLCEKLFIAPGNAGTSEVGENVNISVTDFESIKTFVIENEIDMLVVGPEDPLVKGIGVAKPDAVPNVVPAQVCAPGVFSLCKTLLTNPAGSATNEDAFPPKSDTV